jgi:hypothetical protein
MENELIVSNGFPEKLFISKFGENLFNNLKIEQLKLDKFRCSACGHKPPEEKLHTHLFFHITSMDKNDPSNTMGITLCKLCHLTQHIEFSVKKGFVTFVNSTYNQNNIIRLIRYGQLHGALSQRTIIELKSSPEQILKKIKDGEIKTLETLKVLLNNNVIIDDI